MNDKFSDVRQPEQIRRAHPSNAFIRFGILCRLLINWNRGYAR